MTVEQMRNSIRDAYEGRNWRKRVSAMHDHQVMAIYYRLLNSEKLDKKKKPRTGQLSMFD